MSFNFSEIEKPKANNALIVDSLNLAFRWKHAGRSDFRYDYEKTVRSLASSYKCGTVILTADRGASSYRLEICPDYKGNRKELRESQTEEQKMAFEEFFEEYQATLDLGSFPVLQFQGVEADDIAAHLVKHKKEYDLDKIWLVSSDRDWDLLVSEDVSRWSYVTRKEVTWENWREHYEVPQEKYIDFKCLIGDKGDNISGITGVGPKRAETLLNQYGGAMDIYDAIPLAGQYKYIQAVNESQDTILKNFELMDLLTYCDDAIGEANIELIRESLC